MFESTFLREYVFVTEWKDTNKFHTSILGGTPVKVGWIPEGSKVCKPVSLGHGRVWKLGHLSRR